MATKVIRILLLILSSAIVVYCKKYDVYYMEDYCKVHYGRLYLSYYGEKSSFIIKAEREEGHVLGKRCSVFISTNIYYRIDVTLDKVNLRTNSSRCIDYLFLQNVNFNPGTICDRNFTEKSYDSWSNYVQIDLYSHDGGDAPKDPFDLTVTATYMPPDSGKCEHHQFQCKNRKCIWDGFVCDGRNNCGDWSDEKDCESSSKWMYILSIIVICTVAALFLFCLCFLCRKRRQSTTQMYEYYEPETVTSIPGAPPAYSETQPLLPPDGQQSGTQKSPNPPSETFLTYRAMQPLSLSERRNEGAVKS